MLTDDEIEEIKERDRLARSPGRTFAEKMAVGAMPEYARQAIQDRQRLLQEIERLRRMVKSRSAST